jgi:hypothetical protein
VTLKRFATAFFVLRLAIAFGIKSRESMRLPEVSKRNLMSREREIAAKERKDRKERRLTCAVRGHRIFLDLKLVAAEVD